MSQNDIPETLDSAALRYRQARDRIAALLVDYQAAVARVREPHLPALREALTALNAAEQILRDAVEASPPTLWQRVRTRIIHGIKLGWQKSRGRVEWDDEQKVIERIRRLLPAAQAELLIRPGKESVHRPGVYDLTAADLRRLGIRITDDCDAVVIRDQQGDINRLVDSMLAEIAAIGEERAA
jgi:hypothetical protein